MSSKTYEVVIPNITNGVWDNGDISCIIPVECSKCGRDRQSQSKVYKNLLYGTTIRPKCIHGCKESYEELKLQSEYLKSGFVPKFVPWKPDTRVGSGFTSKDGMNCHNRTCNEFVSFAMPNQDDGKTFICRRCRGII